MAKLFKLSAYIVDKEGILNEESIEDYLMFSMHWLQGDPDMDHIHLTSADIGEWYDDHPLNYMDCPEAEYEKYFKEN